MAARKSSAIRSVNWLNPRSRNCKVRLLSSSWQRATTALSEILLSAMRTERRVLASRPWWWFSCCCCWWWCWCGRWRPGPGLGLWCEDSATESRRKNSTAPFDCKEQFDMRSSQISQCEMFSKKTCRYKKVWSWVKIVCRCEKWIIYSSQPYCRCRSCFRIGRGTEYDEGYAQSPQIRWPRLGNPNHSSASRYALEGADPT